MSTHQTIMTTEQKEKMQAAADKVAVGAFAKAKVLSGWRRWVAIVIGTLAAGAAAWLMAGCTAAVKQDAGGFSGLIVILPGDK